MGIEEPYHPGEIAVQELADERDLATRTGAMISDRFDPRAIQFVARQRMAAAGSVADDGALWASILIGEPGFATASERNLTLHRKSMVAQSSDPLWSSLHPGAPFGLLFIDLASRRRLRVNGRVTSLDANTLSVEVRESYPNCSKYIRRRKMPSAPLEPPRRSVAGEGRELTSTARAIVAQADTFFVASLHPDKGIDASHRGGPPGFLRFVNETTVRIPDYSGNGMFNTLGNLWIHPKAGLVFVDFDRGDLLQLSGHTEVRFDVDDLPDAPGGAGRFWDFTVDRWRLSPRAVPGGWQALG